MSSSIVEKNVSSGFSVEEELSKVFVLQNSYLTNPKNSYIDEAYDKIVQYNKNNLVLVESYKLSHDGYDRHGPKSDLWSFFLIVKDSTNKIYFQKWYGEEWFVKGENFALFLEKSWEITDRISLGRSLDVMTSSWSVFYGEDVSPEKVIEYSELYPEGIYIGCGYKDHAKTQLYAHFLKKYWEDVQDYDTVKIKV